MSSLLESRGFEIVQGVLSASDVSLYRNEVKGMGCARNIALQSQPVLDLAQRLGRHFAGGLRCVRSLFFDKTPERNWPVAWHQDLTIAVSRKHEVPGYGPWSVKDGIDCVQPPVELLESMLSIRVNLDDTPVANGALKVVPGSHGFGKIPMDEVSRYTNSVTDCECSAGDVLLMSPLILHSSARSMKPLHRRVLHFEFADERLLAKPLAWD